MSEESKDLRRAEGFTTEATVTVEEGNLVIRLPIDRVDIMSGLFSNVPRRTLTVAYKCPVCTHEMEVSAGGETPKECDHCGTVFR